MHRADNESDRCSFYIWNIFSDRWEGYCRDRHNEHPLQNRSLMRQRFATGQFLIFLTWPLQDHTEILAPLAEMAASSGLTLVFENYKALFDHVATFNKLLAALPRLKLISISDTQILVFKGMIRFVKSLGNTSSMSIFPIIDREPMTIFFRELEPLTWKMPCMYYEPPNLMPPSTWKYSVTFPQTQAVMAASHPSFGRWINDIITTSTVSRHTAVMR